MKPETFRKSLHAAFLLSLAVLYLFLYLGHPALPGNRTLLGWWGWFDQGEYLKAAKAIARFDFRAENYFFPPLYPALGALFVGPFPIHPFLMINLLSFLAFAHFTIDLARRYLGWTAAAGIFLLSFYPGGILIQIWLEPWTTTLVAPILAFLLRDLDRIAREEEGPTPARMGLYGALWGVVFLARPVDGIALAPLYLFLAWCSFRIAAKAGKAGAAKRAFIAISPALPGALAGVGGFLGFNHLVYGSIGGRYVDAAVRQNGFHPLDLFEKAVSLFLDSGPLYNIPDLAIFAQVKWLALAVPAAVYGLLRGGWGIRLLVGFIATQLAFYLPYSDLLPTGVWDYHNIHYFKWFPPFGAFLVAWMAKDALRKENRKGKRLMPILGSLLAGLLILSVRIDLIPALPYPDPYIVPIAGSNLTTSLTLGRGAPVVVDKINFPTLAGSYQDTYFNGNLAVRVDGKPLRWVGDFRFLPAPQGVDLLFIRPVEARRIEVDHKGLVFVALPVARPLRYGFTLGKPAWISGSVQI